MGVPTFSFGSAFKSTWESGDRVQVEGSSFTRERSHRSETETAHLANSKKKKKKKSSERIPGGEAAKSVCKFFLHRSITLKLKVFKVRLGGQGNTPTKEGNWEATLKIDFKTSISIVKMAHFVSTRELIYQEVTTIPNSSASKYMKGKINKPTYHSWKF